LRHRFAGRGTLALELLELAGELGLAVAIQCRQILLQGGDTGAGALVRAVVVRCRAQRSGDLNSAGEPRLDRRADEPGGLGAVGNPFGGRAGGVGPPRELLALSAARRQSLLGGLAPRGDDIELVLEGRAPGSDRAGGALRLGQRLAVATHRVAGQLPPDLQRLALEPRVQLGRLGLALERPQAGAGLPLDIERAGRGCPGFAPASAAPGGDACDACPGRQPPRSAAAARAAWR